METGPETAPSPTSPSPKRRWFHNPGWLITITVFSPIIIVAPVFLIFYLWLLIINFSIKSIRQKHASEVYYIWLSFFVSIFISFFIFAYFDYNGLVEDGFFAELIQGAFLDGPSVQLPETAGTLAQLAHAYLRMSTNFVDELAILVGILSLVVLPQTLCYIVAGLHGCAKRPSLVSTATKFSILSLIKFTCVFAGIQCTAVIFTWLKRGGNSLNIPNLVEHLFPALYSLASSFLLAMLYYQFGAMIERFEMTPSGKIWGSINAKMTKFSHPPKES